MHFLSIFPVLFVATKAMPVVNLSSSAQINSEISRSSNNQDVINVFPLRLKGREQAVLDNPSWIQKTDSIYGYAQQFVADLLHPKPVVDTISENEKYGNNGDQFRSFGKAVVGGYEGFSNFLNTAVDIPYETMKQVTRKATSYLSSIGSKLIGL